VNYLTIENATRTYGEKVLFTGLDLSIEEGQKIALIAKNGSGKTTLMRVIASMESSEGERTKVLLNKHIKTGFLEQEFNFEDFETVGDAIFTSQDPALGAVRDFMEIGVLPDDNDKLEEILHRMEELKAWDTEAKVREVLTNFKIHDLDAKITSLSGGQRKRLSLAQLILANPDFLILDEPTNHLDIDMIEWLEGYLRQPSRTIFMVTHDRYFMENVCDTIYELDRGKLHKYRGNYSAYLEKKAAKEENDQIWYEKNKKLLKKELEWVNRQPQARSTKAKSRVDAYFDLKDKVVSAKPVTDELEISIKSTFQGSKILECHHVSKSFAGKKLIEDFSYKFKKKERVGVVGPNGAGKSTLLNLLTKKMDPDSGKIVVGETTNVGYYTQDGLDLRDDRRVIEVIKDIAEVIPLEKGKEMTAAQLLERFLFPREQQMVYVSQLSGGERRRLYLLTILMKNPNFLILDEPTNDLDVMTLQVLEDFLAEWPGSLLVVTHDRYFMDRLVDHIFIFVGEGKMKDYNGTYAEYREEQKLISQELARREKLKNSGEEVKLESVTPTENGVVSTNYELSKSEKNELKRLDRDIADLEEKKKKITEQFNDSSLSPAKIDELSKNLGVIIESLEEKEMRWLELNSK
jgi:ABC transport system ATP-binding/permease protein